jgi:hypothetical protein
MASLNIPEQNHVINEALGVLLEQNEISPGINCCAVCGAGGKNLLDCEACGRVCYCSSKCRSADLKVHKRVCEILKEMDDAGDVAYTGDDSKSLAVDDDFAAVLASLQRRGVPPGGWEALGDSDSSSSGTDLRCLSTRMSYPFSMGWAFTTLPCLVNLRRRLAPSPSSSSEGGGGSQSRRANAGNSDERHNGWVDVVVLGASEAECGVRPLSLWSLCAPKSKKPKKVQTSKKEGDRRVEAPSTSSSTVLPAGLRLTFVGPEVPAALHGTVLADVSKEEEVGTGGGSTSFGGGGGGANGKHAAHSSRSRPCCLRYFCGELTDFIAHGGALFEEASSSSPYQAGAPPPKDDTGDDAGAGTAAVAAAGSGGDGGDEASLLPKKKKKKSGGMGGFEAAARAWAKIAAAELSKQQKEGSNSDPESDEEEAAVPARGAATAAVAIRPGGMFTTTTTAATTTTSTMANHSAASAAGGASASAASRLKVDCVFGFNLGLSCPDYEWGPSCEALAALCGATASSVGFGTALGGVGAGGGGGSGGGGLPLVMLTNTLEVRKARRRRRKRRKT